MNSDGDGGGGGGGGDDDDGDDSAQENEEQRRRRRRRRSLEQFNTLTCSRLYFYYNTRRANGKQTSTYCTYLFTVVTG